MRIDEKVHGTGEAQCQLDHVEDRLVLVQPHVVIRDGHCLKGHGFGVLKKRVRTPHILQPIHFQESIAAGHVFGQSQAVVFPGLREEDVCCVSLKCFKEFRRFPSLISQILLSSHHRSFIDGIETHHGDMKEDRCRLAISLRGTHLIV